MEAKVITPIKIIRAAENVGKAQTEQFWPQNIYIFYFFYEAINFALEASNRDSATSGNFKLEYVHRIEVSLSSSLFVHFSCSHPSMQHYLKSEDILSNDEKWSYSIKITLKLYDPLNEPKISIYSYITNL